MRTAPYNTGKILIGKYYEVPKRYEASHDMELLQSALTSKDKPSAWIWVVYTLAVIAFIFLSLR